MIKEQACSHTPTPRLVWRLQEPGGCRITSPTRLCHSSLSTCLLISQPLFLLSQRFYSAFHSPSTQFSHYPHQVTSGAGESASRLGSHPQSCSQGAGGRVTPTWLLPRRLWEWQACRGWLGHSTTKRSYRLFHSCLSFPSKLESPVPSRGLSPTPGRASDQTHRLEAECHWGVNPLLLLSNHGRHYQLTVALHPLQNQTQNQQRAPGSHPQATAAGMKGMKGLDRSTGRQVGLISGAAWGAGVAI